MIDLVLRPAAAFGVALQQVLGRQLVAGAIGREVAQEVSLAAEQPEPVPDLPFDAETAVVWGRRHGGGGAAGSACCCARAPDGTPAQIRIAAKTAVNAADDVGCMSDQGPRPTL